MLHVVCLRCPHVQKPPYSGPCACLYDKDHPVDILIRAKSMLCPAGKFDVDPKLLAYHNKPAYPIPADFDPKKEIGGCGCKP